MAKLEVVISFDTTGSMMHCLELVRAKIGEMVPKLKQKIPGIRIAIFAHGDYCDHHKYVTKFEQFTNDVDTLCSFAKGVERTGGGGNGGEAYEMVLKEVAEKLYWSSDSRKFLIMLGDEPPHEPWKEGNPGIDWRVETDKLKNKGVKIYAVQCGETYSTSTAFYRTIAEKTGGHHLQLAEMEDIVEILMLICTREGNKAKFETFEDEIRKRTGSSGGKDDEAIAAVLQFLKNSRVS